MDVSQIIATGAALQLGSALIAAVLERVSAKQGSLLAEGLGEGATLDRAMQRALIDTRGFYDETANAIDLILRFVDRRAQTQALLEIRELMRADSAKAEPAAEIVLPFAYRPRPGL